MELSVFELLILFVAAVVAGAVDSVVGGGGLVSVPVLLLLGLPPLQALSTNKLQSVLGKVVALIRYARAGLFVSINFKQFLLSYSIPCVVVAMLGAFCATRIETRILELLIPIALILASLSFAFNAYRQRGHEKELRALAKTKVKIDEKNDENSERQSINNEKTANRKNVVILSNLMIYIISYYDGLFGPGAGTFFLVTLTKLKGMGLRASIALSRLLNLSSNIGAIAIYAFAAGFAWQALPAMMLGQVLGAGLGSFFALRISILALWVVVCLITMTIAIVLLSR